MILLLSRDKLHVQICLAATQMKLHQDAVDKRPLLVGDHTANSINS